MRFGPGVPLIMVLFLLYRKLYNCSQEQWDIYKLDPQYDCYVKFPPALTTISRKETVAYEPASPPPAPRATMAPQGYSSDVPQEEGYDSEQMVVDDDNSAPMRNRSRFRKRKPSPREPLRFDFASGPSPTLDKFKSKRRGVYFNLCLRRHLLRHFPAAHVSFQTLCPEEEENAYLEEDSLTRNTKLYAPKNQKRARTLSPESQKRAANAAMSAQRSKHESMKQARRKAEMEARREQRDSHFLREVLSEVPQASGHYNGMHFNFT